MEGKNTTELIYHNTINIFQIISDILRLIDVSENKIRKSFTITLDVKIDDELPVHMYINNKGFIHEGATDYFLYEDSVISFEEKRSHNYRKFSFQLYLENLGKRILEIFRDFGIDVRKYEIRKRDIIFEVILKYKTKDAYRTFLLSKIKQIIEFIGVRHEVELYDKIILSLLRIKSEKSKSKTVFVSISEIQDLNHGRNIEYLIGSKLLQSDDIEIVKIITSGSVVYFFLFRLFLLKYLSRIGDDGEVIQVQLLDEGTQDKSDGDHVYYCHKTRIVYYDTYELGELTKSQSEVFEVLYARKNKKVTISDILSILNDNPESRKETLKEYKNTIIRRKNRMPIAIKKLIKNDEDWIMLEDI